MSRRVEELLAAVAVTGTLLVLLWAAIVFWPGVLAALVVMVVARVWGVRL